MASAKQVHQPIHPSVRDKLDPQYVALHDEVIQYIPTAQSQPWDPAFRSIPNPLAIIGQKFVEVGNVFEKKVGESEIRVFQPSGNAPDKGWPCLVWYHGGGWVLGGLDSENGFLRHVCKYVECVVITINYRHAPEHVYPAAINDSYVGFKWVVSPENAAALKIDTSRLAVGGLSAGGGLAASVSMKAALDREVETKPTFQLLVCPVIDNTATVDTIWKASEHVPWLTPDKMSWYRNLYFSNPETEARNWDASPCFAPKDVLALSPKTFISIAECDLLAPEEHEFVKQLSQARVGVEVQVYKGATHMLLVLAGQHEVSKKLVHDASFALASHFGKSYDPTAAPILSQQ